ncbi:MAG TPA: sigma-70 family RNA polymerase sigma factor [Gemmataceae bacterium]|jgi:RNA polymerase sigma-70 factor (ECF subfamily)|nr:sigma-70 family RNA polymerase sigma factor [Gemmataceae bacterium]
MDLSALINTYRGPLIGLLASWGAPWGDAIEIAEDSFSEAWLNRESCRSDWKEPEAFGRWLRGVALNQYRSWARSRRRRRAHVVTLTPAILERAVVPSSPEPSEHLEALRQAIERLPAKQRQVVLMHYLEETTVNQVAILLSVTAKTVEGRLYQARRSLRRLLGNNPSDSQIGKMLLCL